MKRTEFDIELLIGIALRTGVLLSVAVILAGLLFTFVHHPAYLTSRPELAGLIDGSTVYTSSLAAVLQGIVEERGQAIAMLGILLLIATPVARVAISVVLFALKRDYRYTAITMVVLVLLLLSVASGLAE